MQLMTWNGCLISVRKRFHRATLFHLSAAGKQLVLQMKLTAFLLFIACLHVSGSSFCQKVTLSGRHVSLKKVFSAIEKQTGYVFFYNYNVFDSTHAVSLKIKNENLDDALKVVFANQPLEYTIEDKTISIKKRTIPDSAFHNLNTTPPVWVDIRGVVTNEKGEAVSDILVKVKGTTRATVTNNKGEFALVRVDANATLVLTSVNMEPQEVNVNGRTDLAISMKTKIASLGEVAVQVNTGYQAIPKERATGSFAQVDNALVNRSVSTDILSRLKGVTSGLLFDNSLSKSSNSLQISIRGLSSIYSNITPLVVVDNFPYDGDLNNINPNDIESITVLKDAAAASIWGVRAGNGVIVIVTKKGKPNQPLKMELNTNVTVSQKPNLFYDPNFMSSPDFIGVEKTLFDSGFYDADINSGYRPTSPVVDILAKQRAGTLSAADAAAQIAALSKLDVRNDLSRYFYQKAVNQQYAFNVSGGTDRTNYIFSMGYDKNVMNLVDNGYDRFTLNGYYTFIPVKNLEITAGVTYTQSITQADNTVNQILTGGPSNKQKIYPYAQFADAQGNPLPIVKDYSTAYVEAAPGNGFLNWQFYPLKELGLTSNTTKEYDNRIYTGVRYGFIKGLSAEVKYQYENGITQNRALVPQQSYYTSNLINQYAIVSTAGEVTGYNIPLGDILDNNSTNLVSNSVRGQVNYNNVFRQHNIAVIIGGETRETRIDGNSSRLYGYDDEAGTYQSVNYNTYYQLNPTGSATIFDNNTIIPYTLNRFRSWFSNASYTYKSRYTLSASAREDGSNLFGVKTNQKFIPLWSAGVKWDIDKEAFYHWTALPYLKLRTTYGYSGNMNNTLSAYTTTRAVNGNIINLPYASAIAGDLSLTWEKTGMLSVGIDFGTKQQIVTGSIEYYCKEGIGLIGSSAVPSSTGFLTAQGNYSSMKGNGMDIIINTLNINKAFKWSTNLLLSSTTNTITKNSAIPASLYSIKAVGKPVNAVFGYKWGGLDPVTGDPRGYLNNTLSESWNNIATAGLTNIQTLAYKGSANPTLFGSLRNNFSYRHFSISANIIFKAGYYFLRNSINYYSLYNSWVTNKDYSNRWQKPGDEKKTNVPSMVYPANSIRDNFYLGSEVLAEKGDHIRLQDIRFSYEMDKKQWKKLPLNYIQLYIYANNLGILWRANHYGIDPDYQTGYPAPATFSVGIKAAL